MAGEMTGFFAHGTLGTTHQGLTPAANTNNGYTSSAAQTWLRRRFIQVLEENLHFYRFGQMEEVRDGYLTHSWSRMEKTKASSITKTTGGGGLTANTVPSAGYTVGITPDNTPQPVGTISAIPDQYAIVNTLADMVPQMTVLDIVEQGIMHFARATSRRIDLEIQNKLYEGLSAVSGRIYYVDHKATKAITSIAGYEDAEYKGANIGNGTMKTVDLAGIARMLRIKSAPMYDGASGMDGGTYMLVVHTNISHDIQTETGNTGFINIFAQTPEQVKRMVKGYVGTVYGMSVVESPYVQTKKSSTAQATQVDVYPSYGIARGLYGILKWNFRTYFVPTSMISDGDPLGQRLKYGVKFTFQTVVLDVDCGVLAFSVSPASL